MNLSRVAIIFTIISIPFYFIIYSSTTGDYQRIKYETDFNNAISNSIYDAKFTMNESVKNSVSDEDTHHIDVDEKAVIETFLSSYYTHFSANDDVTKAILRGNILALIVLDYDGFYIYGAREKDGIFDHCISEKHPYKCEKEGKIYFFNLGNEVKIFDLSSADISYENLGYLFPESSLDDESTFKSMAINASIVNEVKSTVKNHKKLGEHIGSSFDYYLPLGESSVLSRNIDSVGLITLIEGETYPKMGKISRFDFSAADIEMNKEIYAFNKNGEKFYTENPDNINADYEIFNSKKEAAKHGYFPYAGDLIK